jgi:hypothetical protein
MPQWHLEYRIAWRAGLFKRHWGYWHESRNEGDVVMRELGTT